MTRSEFKQVVERALKLLPRTIRDALKNIAVIVEDRPTLADLEEVGLTAADLLFGLYRGVPLPQRSFFDGGGRLPDQIILFQGDLEEACQSREELVEEITLTLVHEVGHYLGLTEEELMDLEEEAYQAADRAAGRA